MGTGRNRGGRARNRGRRVRPPRRASLAGDKSVADSTTIPPGIAALIEGTYRNAYILATLKRDEIRRERRGGEMDEMVKTAHAAQAELLSED